MKDKCLSQVQSIHLRHNILFDHPVDVLKFTAISYYSSNLILLLIIVIYLEQYL